MHLCIGLYGFGYPNFFAHIVFGDTLTSSFTFQYSVVHTSLW